MNKQEISDKLQNWLSSESIDWKKYKNLPVQMISRKFINDTTGLNKKYIEVKIVNNVRQINRIDKTEWKNIIKDILPEVNSQLTEIIKNSN